MYQDYYGLNSAPFTAKPDRQFIFTSTDFNRIYTSLRISLREEHRCNVLTGDVGAGKTTLLSLLCQDSSWQVNWVQLPYVNLTFAEMIDLIFDRLAINLPPDVDKVAGLVAELCQQRRQGTTTVLVIDEAQNLPPATLTGLLNLVAKSNQAPWLQILLVGQPGLDKAVRDASASLTVDATDQKAFRYHCLPALRRNDVGAYIKHRLVAAGNELGMLFDSRAVALIADYSGGIPRIINSICGYALLIGQEQAAAKINSAIVSEAVDGLGLQLNREAVVDLAQTLETTAPKIIEAAAEGDLALKQTIEVDAPELVESADLEQTLEVAVPVATKSATTESQVVSQPNVNLVQTQEIATPAIDEPTVKKEQEHRPRKRRRRRHQNNRSGRHVIGVVSVALLVLAFVVGAYTVNDLRNTSDESAVVATRASGSSSPEVQAIPYREVRKNSRPAESVVLEEAIISDDGKDKILPIPIKTIAEGNGETKEDEFIDKIVTSNVALPKNVKNAPVLSVDDKSALKRVPDSKALAAENPQVIISDRGESMVEESLQLQIKPADTESDTQIALSTVDEIKPDGVLTKSVEEYQVEDDADVKEINNEDQEVNERSYVAELEASEQRQGLTIRERLTLWQKVAEQVEIVEVKKQVEEKLQRLQAIVKDSATIRDGDHFVTCKTVTNWQPKGIGSRFTVGKVALFARVHAPKEEETLTVSWHDSKGRVLHTKPFTVRRNVGGGYRLYFWKRFDHTGLFEVRLYNEAQHLIGRKAFLVE